MKHSENDMDKVLKDQLGNKSAVVPDFVWDNIEAELFPKKKRRGFFWWFFPALALLIIFGISIFLYRYTKAEIQQHENAVIARKTNSSDSAHSGNSSSAERSFATHKITSSKSVASTSAAPPVEAVEDPKTISNQPKSLSGKGFTQSGTSSKEKSKTTKRNRSKSLKKKVLRFPEKPIRKAIPENPDSDDDSGRSTLINEPVNLPEINANEDLSSIVNKNKQFRNPLLVDSLPFKPASLSNSAESPLPYQRIPETNLPSFFSVEVYGGPSFYNIAVFKDYFTSGQLSKRTFASSGFETGLNAHFALTPKLGLYAGFAFNRKQTSFNYNLAVTEADYFSLLLNGDKIPLANISDNGLNSCFLAKDASAVYTINSLLLSAGVAYELFEWRKFHVAVNLKASVNLQSAMNLEETNVIEIPEPEKERFSYLQPGAGLNFSYQITDRFSVGLAPVFSKQFGRKDDSFYKKLDELIVPVTLKLSF